MSTTINTITIASITITVSINNITTTTISIAKRKHHHNTNISYTANSTTNTTPLTKLNNTTRRITMTTNDINDTIKTINNNTITANVGVNIHKQQHHQPHHLQQRRKNTIFAIVIVNSYLAIANYSYIIEKISKTLLQRKTSNFHLEINHYCLHLLCIMNTLNTM